MNLAGTHPNIDYVAIAGLIGVFDDVFLRNIRELLNEMSPESMKRYGFSKLDGFESSFQDLKNHLTDEIGKHSKHMVSLNH